MAEDRPRKIAVVGATGYEYSSQEARVECFPWNRLKKLANLADYDIVVLNLLSLDDPKALDPDAFSDVFSVRTAVVEVLGKNPERSDSAIFVLGDPRFNLGEKPPDVPAQYRSRYEVPFLFWTGMQFTWDDRSGDTVERRELAASGMFKPFADKLGRWQYSLRECEATSYQLRDVPWPTEAVEDGDYEQRVLVEDICTSRYGTSIVFAVRLVAEGYLRGRRSVGAPPRFIPLTGPIYFLPESQLTEEEMLEFVLRDLCGVDVSAPAPEWIAEFVAPGQKEIDNELSELDTQINELIEEYNRKIEKRDETRKPLKLLYETGGALEETVWWVLGELGAEVERPEDRTKEDGWITVRVGDETFEGVLEIKGIRGRHFDWGGLRQLNDWIERGMSFRKKRYFGIFVGNSAIEDPPGRRIWPFNKNWVEQAEMRGYAGIRSEDLYVIYLLDRTGRLKRDEFWRRLFASKGPFDVRPYRKKLTDGEKEQLENLPQA